MECVHKEESSIACEFARLGGLEPGSFTKYHEVPGGLDGSVYPRRRAQLRLRLPGQGAWSLVLLQSTMKYQGALMGLCSRGGVLNCGCGCVRDFSCYLMIYS